MQKGEMDITWFPNSWVRIRARKIVVYFDPAYLTTYFSGYTDKIEFSKWPDPIDGLPNGLEKADFIFITHHHKDHCKKITTQRLCKKSTRIFAPASCKKELGDIFQTVKPGDTMQLTGDLSIQVINAYNTEKGSSTRKQHKKGKGVGYILTFGDKTIYHAGDTDLIPDMNHLQKIDIALLPMGGKFTMDCNEAVKTSQLIQPKLVIPIHHLNSDPQKFCRELDKNNINCVYPRIGKPIKVEAYAGNKSYT